VNPKRFILGALLKTAIGIDRRKFEKSCRNLEAVQKAYLLDLISRNAASDFGKSSGFSKMTGIEDFRKALPVSDYENLRPFVERVVKGDVQALFGPAEKIIMFALTSGTTGAPKYIPVTESFLDGYRKGWRIWGSCVCRDHRSCWDNQFMQITSPGAEKYTETGVPCGSISGLMAEMQPPIVKKYYALPFEVSRIRNPELKLYITMRISIVQKVSFLTSPNPSTILQLAKTADARCEEIIRDVADGTCKGINELNGDIRDAVIPYIRKDGRRARALERIVNETGHLYPRDYWPELRLIACWKGGPLKMYTDKFGCFFGEVPIRDLGLMASECRMTIPMQDEGSAGALDIENCFFEFIPEESVEESSPETLLPKELEKGKKYYIILTTSSGLCRYNISDLVEVEGFFYENPLVRFLNKGSRISSVTGEKISEYQVVSAMEHVKKKLGLDIENFSLALCFGEVPYYSILIEKDKIKSDRIAKLIMAEFDETLGTLNIEYEKKRSSNRLGPVSLRIIPEKSFEKHLKMLCEKRAGRLEQFKHKYLLTRSEPLDTFEILEEKFSDA